SSLGQGVLESPHACNALLHHYRWYSISSEDWSSTLLAVPSQSAVAAPNHGQLRHDVDTLLAKTRGISVWAFAASSPSAHTTNFLVRALGNFLSSLRAQEDLYIYRGPQPGPTTHHNIFDELVPCYSQRSSKSNSETASRDGVVKAVEDVPNVFVWENGGTATQPVLPFPAQPSSSKRCLPLWYRKLSHGLKTKFKETPPTWSELQLPTHVTVETLSGNRP
ncbi:hypothetical protein FRC00_002579, partial [Tulasnella sp. 408]